METTKNTSDTPETKHGIEIVTVGDVDKFINNIEEDTILAKAAYYASGAIGDGYCGRVPEPDDMEEWIRVYTDYVWAYAGIYAIASVIAPMQPKLYKHNRKTGVKTEVLSHPCLDLLEVPNMDMTGVELRESLVIYLETVGTAYWEAVQGVEETSVRDRTVRTEKVVTELWPVRPDYITPVPRKNGKGVGSWIFQTGKGCRKKKMARKELVPFRYFNPLTPWYGLGSIQPAKAEIVQDAAMTAWNANFFTNGVTPEGMLTTDKTLSASQMKQLGENIKQYLAGKGRKILITQKGLNWQQISIDPKDVDFKMGRDSNREAILAALGVPPVMVGLLDHAKYDNYSLQIMNFHKHTVLPRVQRIESNLKTSYLPLFPDLQTTPDTDYHIIFDRDALILEEVERKTDRVMRQFEYGLISRRSAAEQLGIEWEGGDDDGGFFIRSWMVPIEALRTEGHLDDAEDEVGRRLASLDSAVAETEKKLKHLADGRD